MKSLEDCIFYNLAKANKKASKALKAELQELGVTNTQTLVLNFLFMQDGVTSAELGKRTQLDSATMAGVLDRMEMMGLLERNPNLEDGRAISVCLTAEGRLKAQQTVDVTKTANQKFLKKFSPEEQMFLRGILKRL